MLCYAEQLSFHCVRENIMIAFTVMNQDRANIPKISKKKFTPSTLSIDIVYIW